MKILIVGAGADGASLAARLIGEGQEVSIIEQNKGRADRARDHLDAIVIQGNGANPDVLTQAKVDETDLMLAMSDNDGANILACHTAAGMGAARTIARVEDVGLRQVLGGLAIDRVVDSRESASRQVLELVRHTGVSELARFFDGRLVVAGAVVSDNSPLVGLDAAQVRTLVGSDSALLCANVRHRRSRVGSTAGKIEPHDEVILTVLGDQLDSVLTRAGLSHPPMKRAIIVGDRRMARRTADLLTDDGHRVVIIHPDTDRCLYLAERHPNALVVKGTPTEPSVYRDLRLGSGDVILGLTERDEVNLMSCTLGRALGASTTIARINQTEIATLLPVNATDAIVSSKLAAVNEILSFVRREAIVSVAAFNSTELEALDILVPFDSPAIGQQLDDLAMPEGSVATGMLQSGGVYLLGDATPIAAGARLLVIADPEAVAAVEVLLGV